MYEIMLKLEGELLAKFSFDPWIIWSAAIAIGIVCALFGSKIMDLLGVAVGAYFGWDIGFKIAQGFGWEENVALRYAACGVAALVAVLLTIKFLKRFIFALVLANFIRTSLLVLLTDYIATVWVRNLAVGAACFFAFLILTGLLALVVRIGTAAVGALAFGIGATGLVMCFKLLSESQGLEFLFAGSCIVMFIVGLVTQAKLDKD